ncbi:MAG TPA: ATP-binding protein [Terriglobales bacterium]|nr:ATP-binding protein [Terriglobales bacterium]
MKKRSSTPAIITLSVCIFFLFTVILAQATFKLTFLQPDTSEETIIFAAVSALIFLLFVALTFVLIRTLLRLYAERKTGVLGSKFRSQMVLGALLLSLGPVIFLFLFSYGLLNRSIEKWFSRPTEDLEYRTNVIASLMTQYAQTNAGDEAQRIAATTDAQKSFHTGNFSSIMDEFRRSEVTLQGGFAFALVDGQAEASFHSPEAWPLLKGHLPPQVAKPADARPFDVAGQMYVLGRARVGDHGEILIAMPLPRNYMGTLRDIERSQEQYQQLRLQRRRLRRTYLGLLLLLTVGVLFASTWLALFLSKAVTRPLVALAEATHEISRGRLDYRVDIKAGSEIGRLVESFNRMAADLETGRSSIEASRRDLAEANAQLEQRTRHIETILESVPSGVLSLDASRRIVHTNGALRRLLRLDENPPISARTLDDLFSTEAVADLEHMLRKADRMGSTTSQLETATTRVNLNVAVTVASLDPPLTTSRNGRQRTGYVVVLEDLTDLLRAQKQAAWREVARRIAHEIKNPLTPLALAAERIQRHLERATPPDAASMKIIRQCAGTVGSSVETVRKLVNEFSTLARFPAAKPQPSDINTIVNEALLMFDGRLDGIGVQRALGPDLPLVQADPEAMKRVIANLVDNAAEALQDSLMKEIVISTAVMEDRDSVEIVVADTGHGVTPEVKEKLFLPYFSTKRRGTGLGLAIVSRIIEDHHGSIRVEENDPVGTRFIVELPVAQEVAVETAIV